jgi:hypothetical protein
MSTVQNTAATRQGADLARALTAAQSSIKAIPHDARNDFHKYRYTSSESIIAECKAALAAQGLSLMPAGQSIAVVDGQLLLVRQFTLLHTSGEERQLATAWPVVPDKGRPADKATASAATTSLAYLLRDLLLAPRVDPADDLAAREDRPQPVAKREKAKAIGTEGAKKLTDLATRKGVCLDEYLAAADVSQFQPLAEVAPEQARQVWRTLQALPDVAPDAAVPQPLPPALVGTNGQPVISTNASPRPVPPSRSDSSARPQARASPTLTGHQHRGAHSPWPPSGSGH